MGKEPTKEQERETQTKRVANNLNSQQQVQTINLVELFWALVAHWKAILLAMLAGAVIFGAYHTFLLKPSYQADASIFISNTSSVISISDLQLSSELTQDYANIILSRTVLKDVIAELDLDMTYEQLGNLVTVSNPEDSHIIQIVVTCGDIELCRDIANSLMNVGIERIYQVVGSGEPTVIDYSEADSVEDVTPGLSRYLAMGGLLGIVLICGLVFLRFITDTTLKTEEDVSNYLRMPVLASVPYFEDKKG